MESLADMAVNQMRAVVDRTFGAEIGGFQGLCNYESDLEVSILRHMIRLLLLRIKHSVVNSDGYKFISA